MTNFFYVYVPYSLKDHKLYIGFTTDLKRRLSEHQQGKNISTSKRLPVKLIYAEAHLSETDAKRREQYFKTAKGKATLRLVLRESLGLLNRNPEPYESRPSLGSRVFSPLSLWLNHTTSGLC